MLRLSFVGLLVGWMLLGSGCVPDDSGPGAKKLQGNAQRVERGLIPQALEEIYTYSDPTSVTYYPNVFRMSEGRIISIFLRAKVVPNGNFTGDEVAIANLTDARSIRGGTLQFSQGNYRSVVDNLFRARVAGEHVYVTDGSTTAIVALNDLYRWRVQQASGSDSIGGKEYKRIKQGGFQGAVVWFAPKAVIAALDPEATRADLSPSFVVAVNEFNKGPLVGDRPMGSSGYVVRVQANGNWTVELAK